MPDYPVSFTADKLRVRIYQTRLEMGIAAANFVATKLQELLDEQDEVRILIGSAPSQNDFFRGLTSSPLVDTVDWSRVTAFHMDEYIGLSADHPQSFRSYQQKHLLPFVKLKTFHEIRGEAANPDDECKRLTKLLGESPLDIVCLGIGENGHLAFNDPPVSFDERELVKVVELDHVCRQQQVNDGCFDSVSEVPTHAITLSMRVFAEARVLSGVVPTLPKAGAIRDTIEGPVTGDCPATIMRHHSDATLFLDQDAASKLTLPNSSAQLNL